MAGVVGAVLLIALAVTLYAQVVHTDVPRWGADAENQWERTVATEWSDLARSMGSGVGASSPVTAQAPAPTPPRALDVPLLGRTAAAAGSGAVAFEPSCAAFTATHTPHNTSVVNDLTTGSRGCLVYRGATAYTEPFTYHVEFGSLLRVQDGRGIVLVGPPLEVNVTSSDEYRVSLTLPGLRGHPQSAASTNPPVQVDLLPGPASREVMHYPNAGSVQWDLETAYPAAWKNWFENEFRRAGFASGSYAVACDPVDCTQGAGGTGSVTVDITGPLGDRDDITLSVSYGVYDVALR